MNAPAIAWRSQLRESDLAAIRDIVAQTGVFNAEEIAVAVELAEDAFSRGAESDYRFLLAEAQGATIAYSCFGRVPFTDGRFDLYWIATQPGVQGQGIASLVLAATEKAARDEGAKKLYAETSSRDIYGPAHRFYVRNGFAHEATLADFYRDGDSKFIFVKALT